MGGVLALVYMSYSSMFIIAAVGTAGYLLLALSMLKDTKPKEAAEALRLTDIIDIAMDKPFLMFALLNCLLLIPYSQMYTLLSVYSSSYVGLNQFWIGVIFAEGGVIVVLFQIMVSAQVKKFRMTTALAVCCLVFAAGFMLLATSTLVYLSFIAVAILTVAEMIWSPAAATLQANLAPENKRGGYCGFSSLFPRRDTRSARCSAESSRTP